MSTTAPSGPGNQLWGIYYTDREYARLLGDPLRTVIEAPTKRAAEEAAGKLGLNLHGRIRSLPNKPSRHSGFLNGNGRRGIPLLPSIHPASTSDDENTNYKPTAHRHRSAEEPRRTG